MPRQRSKKLSAEKTESGTVARIHPEDIQHEEHSESDNESVESIQILEKDAEEEELDRLVLGGGFGFNAQFSKDVDMLAEESQDEENEDIDQDPEDEAGLEGVDDADVGIR